jgi:hypothetical protein
MTQLHHSARIGENVMLELDRILGSFRVKASQQSMGSFTGRLLVILLAFAGAAANADEVVYDDSLENGFLDYSYTSNGGTVDFASTAQAHTGSQSISFTPGGFDAVKFAYNTAVLDTATYSTLTFWYYGTSSQCQALKIILEKTDGMNDNEVASGTLSGYSVCNVTVGTWNEITIDFTAPPMSFNGAYDRISIADGTGAVFGTVYFDDVSIGSSVVDEIFANGFEGDSTPPPLNGLVDAQDITYDTITSDRFTWYDSAGKQRVAVLAHNDAQSFAGSHGGELREFIYQVGATPRTVIAPARGDGGFGYIVSHPGNDCAGAGDTSTLGHEIAGSWTRVFVGRHHAIFRFQQNYPRYCTADGTPAEHDIPVTIDWTFSTGRDNPLWSVSYDMFAIGADVLDDDSRAPYGTMNIDGSSGTYMDNDVAGIRWGDRYQFVTTNAPATLSSSWTWTTANAIPFTELWTSNVDATMGLVQSQTMTRQDAGGGRQPFGAGTYDVSAYWNKTSAAGQACPDGSDDGGQTGEAHSLPCVQYFPYQMNGFSYGPDITDSTNDAKMTWGTQYGFLGQSTYDLHDSTLPAGSTAPGYPRKSYSVFVVLGTHSASPVDAEIAHSTALANTSLSASVGSVATSGAAGVNRTDTITYSPAGYDPVYSALVFNATSNMVTATIGVSSGTLKNPMIIIRNYTSGSYPTTVKFGGTPLTMDADYFPSLRSDKSELWITLNKNVSGTGNAFQIIP